MENEGIKVAVHCPSCGKRVIDKIGKGDVDVFFKCPHCKTDIRVNLNFRLNRSALRYRMAV